MQPDTGGASLCAGLFAFAADALCELRMRPNGHLKRRRHSSVLGTLLCMQYIHREGSVKREPAVVV